MREQVDIAILGAGFAGSLLALAVVLSGVNLTAQPAQAQEKDVIVRKVAPGEEPRRSSRSRSDKSLPVSRIACTLIVRRKVVYPPR